MHEHKSHDPGVYVAAPAIVPEIPGDECGHCEAHDEEEWHEVLVLPAHYSALGEVTDVRSHTATRLEHDPTDMRIKEALVRVVRIEVGIGEAVMRAVAPTPPFDRALHGTRRGDREVILEEKGSIV